MVKSHVVDVHMTPLREVTTYISSKYRTHTNFTRLLIKDFSHVLRNNSNYSHIINMFKIRGVIMIIKDLNIISSTK